MITAVTDFLLDESTWPKIERLPSLKPRLSSFDVKHFMFALDHMVTASLLRRNHETFRNMTVVIDHHLPVVASLKFDGQLTLYVRPDIGVGVVGQRQCDTRNRCLREILCHEYIHAIVLYARIEMNISSDLWKQWTQSVGDKDATHSSLFLQLLQGIFGQTSDDNDLLDMK
jgi:hypothetical protein